MVLQINTYCTVPFTLSIAKSLVFAGRAVLTETSVKSNSFGALTFYPFVN